MLSSVILISKWGERDKQQGAISLRQLQVLKPTCSNKHTHSSFVREETLNLHRENTSTDISYFKLSLSFRDFFKHIQSSA